MRIFLRSAVVVLLLSITTAAFDSAELKKAASSMGSSELVYDNVREVSGFILEHHSLKLDMKQGYLRFLKPILLDSTKYYYGAYFNGEARFQFMPPVSMEREQLKRFVGSDSLDRACAEFLILFSGDIYQKIIESSTQVTETSEKRYDDKAKKLIDKIDEHAADLHLLDNLKALINSTQKPFLLVNVEPEKMGRTFYKYNPFEREEIKLYIEHWEPGNNYMELVNQYSQYNVTEDYSNINGLSKDQIDIDNYKIEASISDKGVFSGKADVTFEVKTTPLRMLQMYINPRLSISSVSDSSGNKLTLKRYNLKTTFNTYETSQFYILFDRDLNYGEKMTLSFEYAGEIIEKNVGEFFIRSTSDWYPWYGFREKASFDMTFKTPRRYEFTSIGHLVDKKKEGDTLITHWSMNSPTANATFSIGNMEKFKFESEDIIPVEVYYSSNLHNELAQSLSRELIRTGSHMEEQIAEDVMNSIRVFEYFFGKYPYDDIRVAEILSFTSTAYPGFVHLGMDTWINTDPWGNDRIHRSHEVAHQWWGVQVGYETYHDKWLSEGFSTYSSLMYLQRLEGIDKFFDKLKEYRSDIYSARKYLIGSGEESGPIALGPRTQSSKTEGDYGLIVYRKGAYVLHMLRNMLIDLKTMNEDRFLGMMREYYEKYRGKNATTAQFRALAEKYAGVDLGWFFNQWVYNSDLPTYEFSYETIPDANTYTVKGHIITKDVPPDFKMFLPLRIDFDNDQKAYIRILVDKTDFEFTLPGLSTKPKKLFLNPFESVLARIKQ